MSCAPRILVLGDVLLDRYWLGSTTRLSAESPIPIVKLDERFDTPGGAGNVYANLTALGADATLLYPPQANTPVKNRLCVGDVQIARWDERDWCVPPSPSLIEQAITSQYDGVVVADYGKGAVTSAVIEMVGALRLPTFVDTKSDPLRFLSKIVDVTFFPNRSEYKARLEQYLQCPMVIATSGSDGMYLIANGVTEAHELALARWVRCVNGAGDSTLSSYAYAVLTGHPNPLYFASVAAAIAVEKPYTSTVTLTEVHEFIQKRTT